MSDDIQRTVTESADKIELKTKVKRGTGTRDEDKYHLRVKGDDATAVASEMATLLDAMRDHDLVADVRAMQPGDADE